MIDHSRKLLFVHIARTGGTSIETALVGKDWWDIDPESKHISASQAKKIYGDEIWRDYKKFTVIRNPWDRVVSMWATKWWHEASNIEVDCSLKTFIKKMKPHPHEVYGSLLYADVIDEPLDFVLRFEDLQRDFSCMLRKVGVEDVMLPHVEKRVHAPYASMYGPEERELVADMFSLDLQRYPYDFGASSG